LPWELAQNVLENLNSVLKVMHALNHFVKKKDFFSIDTALWYQS